LKKEWLDPPDYLTKDNPAYALNRCMVGMGIGHMYSAKPKRNKRLSIKDKIHQKADTKKPCILARFSL
jgi:hypothetical protein